MDVQEYPDIQLPEPLSNSPPPEPKRNYNKLALILGGLLLVGFCLFSIIVSGIMAIMSVPSESQEEWLSLIDNFMQAMVRNDVDSAYDLFSSEAQQEFPQSDLSAMTNGALYTLFDGYESLELESWEINYDLSAGKFVELVYKVQYQDEYEGGLHAVLQDDDGIWKLYWIDLTVPPEKIDDYVGFKSSE